MWNRPGLMKNKRKEAWGRSEAWTLPGKLYIGCYSGRLGAQIGAIEDWLKEALKEKKRQEKEKGRNMGSQSSVLPLSAISIRIVPMPTDPPKIAES